MFDFVLFKADREPKLAVLFCTILAAIANKFVVAPEMPKVEYRTLVDVYVDVMYFLQFFTIASIVIVRVCYDNHFTDEALHWINLGLFLGNIGLFSAHHLWLFIKLRSISDDVELWKGTKTADDIDGEEDGGEGWVPRSFAVKAVHSMSFKKPWVRSRANHFVNVGSGLSSSKSRKGLSRRPTTGIALKTRAQSEDVGDILFTVSSKGSKRVR